MILPNIIPWEPSHVPMELQEELARRRQNISLNYSPIKTSWQNGDWKKYTGPMSAWIRVCSNGRGRPEYDIQPTPTARPASSDQEFQFHPDVFRHKRFIFSSGKDFESTYGFKRTGESPQSQIIGYMPNGMPHVIDNSRTAEYPIHVPAPEVTRVEMTIQKELLRRATIEWVCFSWKQLEYMTPYFLVPGITCMVEMGWNHFNPKSLVDLTNDNTMRSLWENPYPLYTNNIIDSNGNYDVIYGMITNFNWSVDGNNRYTCTTEITSKNRLYAGLPVNSELFVRDLKNKKEPAKTTGNLAEFLNDTQLVHDFRQLARLGTSKFFKSQSPTPPSTNPTPSTISFGLSPALTQQIPNNKPSSLVAPTTIESAFFKDVYDRALSIPDAEKRQLKLSYLYGVFDGRDTTETDTGKTPSKNQADFDQGTATDDTTWFSMGLLSTLINLFSDRASLTDKSSMFELDLDDVIIGAHPNLISANGHVMLVPNFESPKFFWGRRGLHTAYGRTSEKATDFGDPDYYNQYVQAYKSDRKADVTLQTVLNQKEAARDDIDLWINRNVYRLNPPSIQSSEDPVYVVPEKGSRSFPNRKIPEASPCGYLRDIYFNVAQFKSILKNNQFVKSYYDLVQGIIQDLNAASANFWNLQMCDNGLGKWTIIDANFVSARNGKQGKVLTFDMHDANNIVKAFKFRPQMSDAQTNRVLYGEISNPKSQFYSKEEVESLNFSYKEKDLYNDADAYNT